MLDQLVESGGGSKDGARRSGFLLTTSVIVISLAVGAGIYSLFNKDFGLGGGDLELSSLVAPVPVPAEEPPPPETEQKPEKQQPQQEQKAPVDVPTRTVNMARVDEAPREAPPVSTAQNTTKARPTGVFQIGKEDRDVSGGPVGPVRESTGGGGGGGIVASAPTRVAESNDEPPPPPKPKPTPPPATPTPTPKPEPPKKVSLGVINGKAVNLVKPPYPPAAKAVRAAGAVNVSVQIDVNGNVTSASAVSGHPLLRQAAEQAARSSKFTPTVLSGQAVPVSGIIVYNFVAQ